MNGYAEPSKIGDVVIFIDAIGKANPVRSVVIGFPIDRNLGDTFAVGGRKPFPVGPGRTVECRLLHAGRLFRCHRSALALIRAADEV